MIEANRDPLITAIDSTISANQDAVFSTSGVGPYLAQRMRLISENGEGYSVSRWQPKQQLSELGMRATIDVPLGLWNIPNATHVTSRFTSAEPQWKLRFITHDTFGHKPFAVSASADSIRTKNLTPPQVQSLLDLLGTSKVIDTKNPKDREIWDASLLDHTSVVDNIRKAAQDPRRV